MAALCAAGLCIAALCAAGLGGTTAVGAERPMTIVALGDSLVAGYGLAGVDAFPSRLQQALADKGFAVTVVNAGVSGDTASGGLARLDWSVPEGTDAVILELGANDALRGFDPAVTRKALDAILGRLAARKIPVLLCGMLAPPNLGAEYGQAFNAIYPDLAAQYAAILYPFFLAGVAADPTLNQRDGLHPTPAGVAVIVERILPTVEQLIGRAKTPRS
jgi:acyl-CoA thioesterase-1